MVSVSSSFHHPLSFPALASIILVIFAGTSASEPIREISDVQVIHGKVASTQLDNDAHYDDYTSVAECPAGYVVLGCQSITTGCDYDGSAFRETPTTCVSWNSMTFWGVPCPGSTVQAVAFCKKLPKKSYNVHYLDDEEISACDKFPGSVMVSCGCAIVVGDLACAGAWPTGNECRASPDSKEVRPGVVCVEGEADVEIVAIDVVDGSGTGVCLPGLSMTDCTCAGKACLKKTIGEGSCTVEVKTDDEDFYGAHVICTRFGKI